MAASNSPRHLKTFMHMVKEGKLHAPNLKTAHIWLHGGKHRSNNVVKTIVTKHLLGLRWMNPNSLVFLRDSPDAGHAHVEFELWNGRRSGFAVAQSDSAEKVIAKLMFAARDLGLDEADVAKIMEGAEYTVPEPVDGTVEPAAASAAAAAPGGASEAADERR